MADSRSAKDARGNPIREVRFGGEAEVSPEEEELRQPAPLPEWSINWTSLGIRIETLLPVDPETLVNTTNVVGRPAFSMEIVDVHVLVAEELAIDPPTELGEKLKAAQKTGEAEWLTPELVNMVLEGFAITLQSKAIISICYKWRANYFRSWSVTKYLMALKLIRIDSKLCLAQS
nr:uncharacterized protein LOC112281023 isoform X1 [Physcomitrium patens]|eukprot:XP_024372909.1 uncharacterized protein LOC112281023 isoform X1 [Physcomitrella patens]